MEDIELIFLIINLVVLGLSVYGLNKKSIICLFGLFIQILMLFNFFALIQTNQALLAFSIIVLIISAVSFLIKALER